MRHIHRLGALALAALVITLGIAPRARAVEELTTLRSFCSGCPDGDAPWSGIALGPDGAFYGTTFGGGNDTPFQGQTYGAGVVYRVTAAGKFTVLHAFDASLEGAYPNAGLNTGADGYLYGTTTAGGAANLGCVFRISTSGDFTVLHEFVSGEGWAPYSPPVEDSAGNWYGTTLHGGAYDDGTVYEIKQDGTFLTLYSFTGHADGADAQGGLVLASDGNLYGTTLYAGNVNNAGTIFRMTPTGVLTTLHAFSYTDGSLPAETLTIGKDGGLYGTTMIGGANSDGVVFRITLEGTFRVVYSFIGSIPTGPTGALTAAPEGGLYGVRAQGGSGYGALYRITPSGKYTEVYDFTGEAPGGLYPEGALALGKDGTLYGATLDGGRQGGGGTAFRYVPTKDD